jgi:hypothetical protein
MPEVGVHTQILLPPGMVQPRMRCGRLRDGSVGVGTAPLWPDKERHGCDRRLTFFHWHPALINTVYNRSRVTPSSWTTESPA